MTDKKESDIGVRGHWSQHAMLPNQTSHCSVHPCQVPWLTTTATPTTTYTQPPTPQSIHMNTSRLFRSHATRQNKREEEVKTRTCRYSCMFMNSLSIPVIPSTYHPPTPPTHTYTQMFIHFSLFLRPLHVHKYVYVLSFFIRP